MSKLSLIITTIAVFSTIAFSHGEDKPGPHGGFIKMPGAFHTEVVVVSKHQVKVYLLDMDWKNPTTEKSSVMVNNVNCKPDDKAFTCDLGKKVDLHKKGKLEVKATRQEQQGNMATYELPLNRH